MRRHLRTTSYDDADADDIGSSNAERGIGLPAGLAVIQLILAYEWLISGIKTRVWISTFCYPSFR